MRVCRVSSLPCVIILSMISYKIIHSYFVLWVLGIQISEEEGRLKKDEEEQKEIRKKKREHEEQWEGTRENRVCTFF